MNAVDAVVLGGGPAGSAAARMLAVWGYRTVLVSGERSGGRLWETLTPSCRKPLQALGLLSLVEEAGFLPTRGNSVAWGGAGLRSIDFPGDETGWQVEKGRLAELLQRAAADCGVTVIEANVRSVSRLPEAGEEEVRRSVDWEGGSVQGRWVLDCSGRAGVLARQGARRRAPGPATLALVGEWVAREGEQGSEGGRTLVESYQDGWAWSIPLGDGRRMVAAMVDPRASGLVRGRGVEGLYQRELGKTRHHLHRIANARLTEVPWACTTTAYDARSYGGDGYLLVGDAGSFLDPLSSFGVKKALASAWLAAVVVNTSMHTPAMGGAALELFETRERATYRAYAELAASYYREAAEYHSSAFWEERARVRSEDVPENVDGEVEVERVLTHPAVPGALERIRNADRLEIHPATSIRRKERPVVEGRQVVLQEHLFTDSVPDGIRAVEGVELPQVLDLLARYDRVPDLYEVIQRARPETRLPDLLGALAVLVALDLVRTVND